MDKYSTTPGNKATIKIYPKLGRAAMRANLGRSFRWWSVLRDVDTSGRGWFSFEEVLAVFIAHGWSRKQAYDCFHAGAGGSPFFTVATTGHLYLSGLENVCMVLDCEPGRPVEIQAEAVEKQNTFQAEIYAHGFVTERKVSRNTLQSEYGIGRNTQRRYEHATGVTRAHNSIRANEAINPLPLPSETCHTWWKDGDYIWQAPNTYKLNDVHKARRGMSRRVTKDLRRAVDLRGDGEHGRFMVDNAKQARKRVFARRTGDTFGWWRASGDEVIMDVFDLVQPRRPGAILQ